MILNKRDYIETMQQILNDHSTFERMTQLDPLKHNLLLYDKVNRFHRKLLNNNRINEEEYKNIFATGTNPGITYFLPKVHKANIPLRPVLSSFKTHCYKLSTKS